MMVKIIGRRAKTIRFRMPSISPQRQEGIARVSFKI